MEKLFPPPCASTVRPGHESNSYLEGSYTAFSQKTGPAPPQTFPRQSPQAALWEERQMCTWRLRLPPCLLTCGSDPSSLAQFLQGCRKAIPPCSFPLTFHSTPPLASPQHFSPFYSIVPSLSFRTSTQTTDPQILSHAACAAASCQAGCQFCKRAASISSQQAMVQKRERERGQPSKWKAEVCLGG